MTAPMTPKQAMLEPSRAAMEAAVQLEIENCIGAITTRGLALKLDEGAASLSPSPALGAGAREARSLSWARPLGATMDSMRKHVWETGLADLGDTILVWVNEGDFWMLALNGCELKEFKNPEPMAPEPGPIIKAEEIDKPSSVSSTEFVTPSASAARNSSGVVPAQTIELEPDAGGSQQDRGGK